MNEKTKEPAAPVTAAPVDVLAVGDHVETWFDTGAMGCQLLYGRVIAAGPKTYRVRWESGITNRLAQGRHDVRRARDDADARAALARIGGAA